MKMKKWSKILAVVLACALLVCGVVLIATAADEPTSGFSYTKVTTDANNKVISEEAISGDGNLGVALKNAKPNSTITMNGDTTWTFDTGYESDTDSAGNPLTEAQKTGKRVEVRHNDPSQGKVTLDLGGHTLTVVQLYKNQSFVLNSSNLMTIKNGTIKVVWSTPYDTGVQKAFPLFDVGWGDSKITLENVNTYTSGLVRSQSINSNAPKVTIRGGTHFTTADMTDTFGGFIESRSNVIFKAYDATFYTSTDYGLVLSTHYKRTLDDKSSTFYFERCTILGESITTPLIGYANEFTHVEFDDCDIFGSFGKFYYISTGVRAIDIPVHNEDKKVGIGAMQPGSIVIGAGCKLATKDGDDVAYHCNGTTYTISEKTYDTTAYVAYKNADNGNVKVDQAASFTTSLQLPPEVFVTYDASGNPVIDYTTTPTEFACTFDVCDQTPAFDVNGEIKYYGDVTLPELLNAAVSDDYITLLYDCKIETFIEDSAFATIKAGMTLDLGGNKLNVIQHMVNGRGQSRIAIDTTEPVIVKSGVITAKHPDVNANYPVFMTTGKNCNFTIQDVESYVGILLSMWGGSSTINIEGGTHHAIQSTMGHSSAGLIVSLAPSTVNFRNTTVYTKGEGRVMGGARAVGRVQTWNFENCNLISGDGVGKTLISTANENTRINFKGCNIYGSINPVQNTTYDSGSNACGGPAERTILFDSDNYFMSTATLLGGEVVYPKMGAIIGASKSASFTYNANRGEGDDTTVTYTLDRTVDTTLVFEITDPAGNITYVKSTIDKAIAAANSKGNGSTVRFLNDITWDGLHYTEDDQPVYDGTSTNVVLIATITDGVTIDLDKREFRIIQGNVLDKGSTTKRTGQDTIKISTGNPVIFKDGTIKASRVSENSTYAIMIGTTYNITLENITSYTGSIFYSYGGTGKITFKGGEHHAAFLPTGTWGASWLEAHNGLEFSADGTLFHAQNNRYLFSYITNKNTASATFKFDNCSILAGNSGSDNIFRYANNLTSAEFNNSYVYGTLDPVLSSLDSNNGKTAMTAGSVEFGEGTVFKGAYAEGLISVPTGFIMEAEATNQTFTYQALKYTDVVANGYQINTKTETIAFTHKINGGTVVEYFPVSGSAGSSTSEVVTIKPGATIPLPAIDTVTVHSNGFYKLQYTGRWLDADGNVVEALVAGNEDIVLSPEATITPYLSAAKYNVKLAAHYTLNLILPKTLPDGVTITSVKNANGSNNLGKVSNAFDDMEAVNAYVLGYIAATDINNTTGAQVTMTITLPGVNAGKTVTVVQNFKNISVFRYVNSVLETMNGENYAYSETERTLVANLLRYSTLVMNYVGTAVPDAQATLCEKHAGLWTISDAIAEKYKNLLIQNGSITTAKEAFNGYVSSISFSIEREKPRIQLQIPYSAKVTGATFKVLDGWTITNRVLGEGVGNGINWESTTYSANPNYDIYYWSTETDAEGNNLMVWKTGGVWRVVDETGKWLNNQTVEESTVTKYYAMVRPDNVPIFNADRTFTISLTSENSATAITGTYSIGTYYKNMKASYEDGKITADTFKTIEDFVLAVVNYSQAASDYRFGPAIDKNGYVSYDRFWGLVAPEN